MYQLSQLGLFLKLWRWDGKFKTAVTEGFQNHIVASEFFHAISLQFWLSLRFEE